MGVAQRRGGERVGREGTRGEGMREKKGRNQKSEWEEYIVYSIVYIVDRIYGMIYIYIVYSL